MLDDAEVIDQVWDAIIVGTGIGGATLGYALAHGGWRVLFCEKGQSQSGRPEFRGDYAESFTACNPTQAGTGPEVLRRAGRYWEFIEDHSRQKVRKLSPFIGAGSGGSSAIFGMAMERFFPADFEPRQNYADVAEASLPDAWPISYDELTPFYEAAERLYRLRGGADPLRSGPVPTFLQPPPLTQQGQEMFQFLQRKGFNPYRVPMACEFLPGCSCCQGYLCARNCKNDSERICLRPAVVHHAAQIFDECEIVRLEATRSEVREIIANRKGRLLRLRGRIVVLAAGALQSPRILLDSMSPLWPAGLANDSGLVGRNLMRHFNDLYAVFLPSTQHGSDNRRKEIALGDFYHHQGTKLGTVQSFGRLPPASLLAQSLENDLHESPFHLLAPALSLIQPALHRFLRHLVNRSYVLATIAEDLPYADNRISLAAASGPERASSVALNYTIRSYDRARIKLFRALMKDLLRTHRFMLIKQAENNQMLAHACGTCRFGMDPHSSVLDRNNRAHGVANLYVVDSSFFPSSSGTNPSLTIAANALRVAAHLLGSDVGGLTNGESMDVPSSAAGDSGSAPGN